MSRGIILYQSKYGATKKYVDWLVEELGYDYAETKNSKVANLLNYDVIILGGGVYASGIAGLQFLKKNMGLKRRISYQQSLRLFRQDLQEIMVWTEA